MPLPGMRDPGRADAHMQRLVNAAMSESGAQSKLRQLWATIACAHNVQGESLARVFLTGHSLTVRLTRTKVKSTRHIPFTIAVLYVDSASDEIVHVPWFTLVESWTHPQMEACVAENAAPFVVTCVWVDASKPRTNKELSRVESMKRVLTLHTRDTFAELFNVDSSNTLLL